MDCQKSGAVNYGTGTNITLTDRAVRMWPTPCAREDQKSPAAHMAMKRRMSGGGRKTITSLTVLSKLWPTPAAHDCKASGPSQHERNSLMLPEAAISGLHAPTIKTVGNDGEQPVDLNPLFVESLMNLPTGWTDPLVPLEPTAYTSWETESSHLLRRLRSCDSLSEPSTNDRELTHV